MTFIQTWFLQGLFHPIQTPSHIILIVGLGILIGQYTVIFKGLTALIATTLIGILLNQNLPLTWNMGLTLLSVALIIGLLTTLKLKQTSLSITLVIILSSMGGLSLGFDSSPIVIPGLGSNSIYNWLLGAIISIIATTTLTSVVAQLLGRYWDGIILRVIGSWIATSALFTLTLSFAKV